MGSVEDALEVIRRAQEQQAANPTPVPAPQDAQPSAVDRALDVITKAQSGNLPPPTPTQAPLTGLASSAVRGVGDYLGKMGTGDYWKGLASGAATVPMGMMQTISHGIEAMVPPSPGVHPATQQIESGLSKLNEPGNEAYESGRFVGPYAGALAATAAAPYVMPEAMATMGGTGLIGAGLRGALGGAALGAASPVEKPGNNFGEQKLGQVLPAMALGGALSGVGGFLSPKPNAAALTPQTATDVLSKMGSDYWTAGRIAAASDLNKQQAAAKLLGLTTEAGTGLIGRVMGKAGPWAKDWLMGLPAGELVSQTLLHPEALMSMSGLLGHGLPVAGAAGLFHMLRSPAGQAAMPYISSGASEAAARNPQIFGLQ